jgi:hypothetical protein
MAVRLSALYAGSALPSKKIPGLISVRGRVDHRTIVRLEGSGELKKSNELIGIQTRDLLAFSIALQQTTPPRVPEQAVRSKIPEQCV